MDVSRHSDTVSIRLARCEDLQPIVTTHLACFSEKDNLAVRFGPAFITEMYRWFLSSKETFVLVATVEGKVAGLTAVCDREYTAPMLRACWRAALRGLFKRPWLAFQGDLLHRLVRVFLPWLKPKDVPEHAQVAFTMVSPPFRGRRIAQRLRYRSFDIAYERGHRSLIVGLLRENKAIRHVNEKCGFVLVEDLGDDRYVYMEKKLAPPIGEHFDDES